MPHRRRKNVEAFSLFAFQDIITSVTGIVILITLLLAIELMERVERSPASQTLAMVEMLDTSIEDLEQEKLLLEQQLKSTAIDTSDLPTTDPTELNQLLNTATEEVSYLKERKANAEDELRGRKVELAKQENSIKTKNETKQLKEMKNQILAAERKLKKIKSQDQMFFKTGTKDKSTWLVEVSQVGYLAAQLGETKAPIRLNTGSDFDGWLSGLSPSKDALYLMVKQSGSEGLFYSARESLMSKKIDFGYEVVDETRKVIDPIDGAGL